MIIIGRYNPFLKVIITYGNFMSYLLTIPVNFLNQAFDLPCNTAVRWGEDMRLWGVGGSFLAEENSTGGSDAGVHRPNRR